METSQTITKLAEALKSFQKSAPNVTKDAKANYGRYATLGNVIETTRDPLSQAGLSFAQFPDGDGLTTIVMHESGEWIRATAKLTLDKQTPQGQGSAITYMRRYALSAALGIATEDDDDGHEASKPPQARHVASEPTKPTATENDAPTPIDVQKDRIAFLLKSLGFKPTGKTKEAKKKEYANVVFDMTGLHLVEENYEQIANTLAAKLEAKEAEANQ